ncbi:MAG: HEAT repeat domain-containing protein [Bacteroidetes bacterium]|nr:HEAT repeat domain-containing protein [Bacteroidota bacterium]
MSTLGTILPPHDHTEPFCVERLITQLCSSEGATRLHARTALVRIGTAAVPFLLPLLQHPNHQVRWEGCMALGRIRDPRAAHALAALLTDEDMDVRWVAADALIELEHEAVAPVLEQIEEHFDEAPLRAAAHHVLVGLREQHLLYPEEEKVLDALKVTELPSKAAFTANHVLEHLRTIPHHSRH